MDAVRRYFTVQLPGYLRSLPLPKTLFGFKELTRDEWLQLVPFVLFLLAVLYILISPFKQSLMSKKPRPRVNKKHRLSEKKIADNFDIEDLGEKVAFCRCWKSSKFPHCDGSHNTHNKETGDNLGPVVINNKKPSKKED